MPAACRTATSNQEGGSGWQSAHFMAADGSGSLAAFLAFRSETTSSKSVCRAKGHLSAVDEMLVHILDCSEDSLIKLCQQGSEAHFSAAVDGCDARAYPEPHEQTFDTYLMMALTDPKLFVGDLANIGDRQCESQPNFPAQLHPC